MRTDVPPSVRGTIIALLLVLSAPAQNTPLSCGLSAESVPTLRAEGQAELIGDLLFVCSGGVPTPAGELLPLVSINLYLSPTVSITSRITYASGFDRFSEALLFVDEPSPDKQTLCGSPAYPYSTRDEPHLANLTGVCGRHPSSPKGDGIGTYDPDAGPVRGNVYQARSFSNAILTWVGIPFDSPGPGRARIVRITNVRANVSQIGVPRGSSYFLEANLSASATGVLNQIANPLHPPTYRTIAGVARGAARFDVIRRPGQCFSCESANRVFGEDHIQPLGVSTACDGRPFTVRFEELQPAAFRQRTTGADPFDPKSQDRLGAAYLTESGFYKREANGDRWPDRIVHPANRSEVANLGSAVGLADSGTRLTVAFSNVPAGVRVWLPPALNVVHGREVTGLAVRLSGDSSVELSSGVGIAYFEIRQADAMRIEAIEFEPVISYTPGIAAGVSNVDVRLGSLGAFPSASPIAQIPRFAPNAETQPWLEIAACRTILLFPWVTHNGNTDTGLAIVNASLDPFTSEPDAGRCAIHYFGAAGTITAESPAIAGGEHFTWTLGNGGALPAVPGFAGYVIADCALRSAYGFAFIADPAGLRSGTAYLGLTLNDPLRTRTGAIGERLAH